MARRSLESVRAFQVLAWRQVIGLRRRRAPSRNCEARLTPARVPPLPTFAGTAACSETRQWLAGQRFPPSFWRVLDRCCAAYVA